MALFEKAVEGVFEGGVLTGVAVGVGVLMLAPGLLPAIGRAMRPLAVSAIRTGMTVYNRTASTLRETTEDLLAEARAELEAHDQGGGGTKPSHRRSRTAEAAP
ncbi:MAG TPA: DUF5132 domain-containing protein [Stellaceae bacterium]|nr:DUF5132 domain-containing protein [Stellaceae bacterium]